MSLPNKGTLQRTDFALVDITGKAMLAFAQWLQKTDAFISAVASGQLPNPTSLTNAANDAAAAAAGVGIGQMYRNGSVVMIRVA